MRTPALAGPGGFGGPPFGGPPFGAPGGFGGPPFGAPFGAPYGGFPPYGAFPPYGGAPGEDLMVALACSPAPAGLLCSSVELSVLTGAEQQCTQPSRPPASLCHLQRPTAARLATALQTRTRQRRPATARLAALAARPATVRHPLLLLRTVATHSYALQLQSPPARCPSEQLSTAVVPHSTCHAHARCPSYLPFGSAGAPGGAPAPQSQWQELHDDQGRPYYYNPSTGVTQVRGPPQTRRLGAAQGTVVGQPCGTAVALAGCSGLQNQGRMHANAGGPPHPTAPPTSTPAAVVARPPTVPSRVAPLPCRPAVGEAPRHVSSSPLCGLPCGSCASVPCAPLLGWLPGWLPGSGLWRSSAWQHAMLACGCCACRCHIARRPFLLRHARVAPARSACAGLGAALAACECELPAAASRSLIM